MNEETPANLPTATAAEPRLRLLATRDKKPMNRLFQENSSAAKSWMDQIQYSGITLHLADSYIHFLMSLSWFGLMFLFMLVGILNSIIFAWLYFLVDCGLSCEVRHSFFKSWNLSVQTFLTIGYGTLTPQNTGSNVLVFFQGFSQLIMAAVFAGVPYLKFSKPRSKILFSSHIVVGMTHDKPTMTFRLAVLRESNRIYNLKCHVDLVYIDKKDSMIRILPMKLSKDETLLLVANLVILHPLDAESPVLNIWNRAAAGELDLNECDLTFHVNVTGWDPVYQSEINASHYYSADDSMHFNCRFGDMIRRDGSTGRKAMYLSCINDIVPQDVASSDEVVHWVGEHFSQRYLLSTNGGGGRTQSFPGHHARRDHLKDDSASALNVEMKAAGEAGGKLRFSPARKRITAGRMSWKGGRLGRVVEVGNKSGWCRRACCPVQASASLRCCCCAHNKDHQTIFRILKNPTIMPIHGHTGWSDLWHGSTWFWYVLRWSFWSFAGLMLLVYTLLCTSMAVPLFLTNLLTSTNLLQDVDQETGVVIENFTIPATYESSFFFAHQTISSIGYGVLSPRSDASHWFVAFFGFFGFIVLSMLSGVIWSKYTSSMGALVAISKVMVVTKFEGKRALMFRMAGLWRHHPITSASVNAMVYVQTINPVDGQKIISGQKLQFVRHFNPLFVLPGTFIHIMEDEDSPLKNMTEEKLREKNMDNDPLWVSIVFEGLDTCLGQSVAAEHSYNSEDIRWSHRFEDIIQFDDDLIRVDMNKFHKTLSTVSKRYSVDSSVESVEL